MTNLKTLLLATAMLAATSAPGHGKTKMRKLLLLATAALALLYAIPAHAGLTITHNQFEGCLMISSTLSGRFTPMSYDNCYFNFVKPLAGDVQRCVAIVRRMMAATGEQFYEPTAVKACTLLNDTAPVNPPTQSAPAYDKHVIACQNASDLVYVLRHEPVSEATRHAAMYCDTRFNRAEMFVVEGRQRVDADDEMVCLRRAHDKVCLWTRALSSDGPAMPSPPPQANFPEAPPTLSPGQLEPLSWRLAQINQAMRQSLPIVTRHCGSDATCRKDQTAAIHELAAKETAIAKALRNPTTYTSAVLENDTINACIVMWRASEDFAATMQCINDAAPTM
jgi:hypothetical protein